ncbi:MAG TPA: hypothetical protein VHQ66_09720 [Myxococcota bacterium]|nr:hypothetical protein [Myxococcota bacterium]
MARIIGNLVPEDDGLHPLGPEPAFNESMYFNFFDRSRSLGGFVRLGNRANEGYAELTVCLYLPAKEGEAARGPAGRVLFTFQRPAIANNDAFDAGGLRFEVLEPTERLRTVYEGPLLDLADPRAMADPGRAFRESPKRRVRLDLLHEAAGPLYGSAGSASDDTPPDQQFARAHYEQHMHVTGSLDLEGERFELDGYGLRDHSWGPRTWQAIHSYDWLTMNFGPDFGAMVSVIQRDPAGKHVRRGGVLVRNGELEPIVDARVEADYGANGLYHEKVRARVRTAKGEELAIEGEVTGFIPLRNRRDGRVTHIGEGMTRWRVGDRVGYGLSELLRQVK